MSPFFQCRHMHVGHNGLYWQCTRKAGHWFRHVDSYGMRWSL